MRFQKFRFWKICENVHANLTLLRKLIFFFTSLHILSQIEPVLVTFKNSCPTLSSSKLELGWQRPAYVEISILFVIDRCEYVRRLIRVEGSILNLVPIAQKLDVPEEAINEAIRTWKNDEEQLKTILQQWSKEQDDDCKEEPAVLRNTLQGLNPEGWSQYQLPNLDIALHYFAVTLFIGFFSRNLIPRQTHMLYTNGPLVDQN